MSIRLNKAIRELNIGLQTAVEFLKKRSDLGEVRDDLSFKLSDGQYNALKEEFKSDKEVRNQAEKLLQKHPKEKKRPSDRKEQKPVKATQPQKYTVLGKIDLDSLGKKPVPKAAPEAKPEAPADKASAVSHEPEEVKPVAAQAAAKPVEEAPKPVETVKPVVGTVAAQPDKAAAGKVEDKPAQTEPAVAPEPQKAEPKAEKEDAAPAGSEEGKIFIEPQGFAVMSEIGKDEGADIKTLDSIDKYLNTKYGLVLNNPAYSKYYIQYGEISTYPGGYKENAGIFTHNNAWIICAEAYAGRGDKAFEYYSKIAPAFNEEISDLHKTETYVYGQMIAGKDASRFGEGKNSWLTGTAAWNMVAISQYILGVQADFDGLKIDPSIPHEWDGMTATRQFRGATYNITVKNPDHVCKGIKSVTVDGKAVEGNVLPVAENGATVNVEVVMG